ARRITPELAIHPEVGAAGKSAGDAVVEREPIRVRIGGLNGCRSEDAPAEREGDEWAAQGCKVQSEGAREPRHAEPREQAEKGHGGQEMLYAAEDGSSRNVEDEVRREEVDEDERGRAAGTLEERILAGRPAPKRDHAGCREQKRGRGDRERGLDPREREG